MKKTILISVLLFATYFLFAQMQTIQLDAKKLQFDNGLPLPAEASFIFSVNVDKTVAMVKMKVSNVSFDKNRLLYESKWIRKDKDESSVALLTNHYKLRANRTYNYRFVFYRLIQQTELEQLQNMLGVTANSVLNSNVGLKDDAYVFYNSPSDIFASLNLVLENGLVNFEKTSGKIIPAFSGVVENMLVNLTKTDIERDSSGNILGNSIIAIENQLKNEILMLSNQYIFTIIEETEIMEYPTEKKSSLLTLNLGYGGIYESGTSSSLNYFSGPYAGISFPLGNKAFSSNFWNNASASAGVFLTNFETSNGSSVSGPIIGLPVYAAFGYRLFNYMKFHAGATVLEEKNNVTTNTAVYIAPFIGLSIEFHMWIGFNRNFNDR